MDRFDLLKERVQKRLAESQSMKLGFTDLEAASMEGYESALESVLDMAKEVEDAAADEPTVVVRCKSCVQIVQDRNVGLYCHLFRQYRNAEDYCSSGEAKEVG